MSSAKCFSSGERNGEVENGLNVWHASRLATWESADFQK